MAKKQGGIKGRSGRKGLTNERIRAAVIDKSWEIILTYLKSPNANQFERRKIALEIAKKTIPQQIDGNLKGDFTIKWATE